MTHLKLATALGLLALSANLVACGDDSSSEGGGAMQPGTVTDLWSGYCVATFNADTQIEDWGEPLFTAKAGEQYLISGTGFGGGVELLYLTSGGPYDFEAPADAITDSCAGSGVSHAAALTDVTVYSDENLTTEICQLTAGSTAPGAGTGFSLVGGDLFGPATYEVDLGGFSDQCGDATQGYVSVPEVEAFDVTTWLVPITTVQSPS